MPEVQAYVYDITQGMAAQMSMALLGKQIDIVPHTGIVVFGREYFFGSGPCVGEPGNTIGITPARTLSLGETTKTREELEAHIRDTLAVEHCQQNYNLLTHNCNHYANDLTKFLLPGKCLPDSIVNVAEDALSTPQGQSLRVMIEGMDAQMRSQTGSMSTMNPYAHVGNSAPAPVPAPAAVTTPNPTPAGYSTANVAVAPLAPIGGVGVQKVSLQAAVQQLLRNPTEVAKTAIQTMLQMTDNIIHKKDPKFRRLKQANPALQKKLTSVPGGVACLLALGFTDEMYEGEPMWLAPASRDGFDKMIDGKAVLAAEYDKLLGTPIDTTRPKPSAGGIDGMIENALQNPASLQRLLSNPMVAQMARANPGMVEGALRNPSVQAAMQQYPEMRSQVEQLIGRPLNIPVVAPSPPAVSGVAPGSFDQQLAQLAEMGFHDRQACLRALQNAGGDVEVALATLVG